jgi:hypothetical protein
MGMGTRTALISIRPSHAACSARRAFRVPAGVKEVVAHGALARDERVGDLDSRDKFEALGVDRRLGGERRKRANRYAGR